MEKVRYGFNYSQDIVHLQTKYSLFKRVANIVFSISVDKGFDKITMTRALELLIGRNDCLRLKFEKGKKGEILQYFRDKVTLGGVIPSISVDTYGKLEKFILKFRRKALDIFKGETLKVAFVQDPDGKELIFMKISHMVADSYGIGVLIGDLFAVYGSLVKGEPLPPAPAQFEEILKKDTQYRNNQQAIEKDREFFNEYYNVRHPEHPVYCGIHGVSNDRWMKLKKKGAFALPYLFVKCDTKGYRFIIPASVVGKAEEWCSRSGISMNTFFFYTCAIACSLKNGKAPYQLPLELLNCRATVADRKAAGTKVQSLSVYTTVDYNKSFNDNIQQLFEDQSELYRHTKLSYLEIQDIEHKLWNYSMMSQITNFSFSFIPVIMPEGVSMQIHSNGKGALPAYIALMHDLRSNEIHAIYDVQIKMCNADQMVEFQNTYMYVVESVLSAPDAALDDIFKKIVN